MNIQNGIIAQYNLPKYQRLQNKAQDIMYNNPKQSTSGNKIYYEAKKPNYHQYKHKGPYRKQTRYQDERDQYDSYYHKKSPTFTGNTDSTSINPTRSTQNINKKINIGKKTHQEIVNYYIEFKNREIQLGSTWKEIIQSIDRYFPQTDMILNLAVKINVWEELRNISTFIIPNQDVQEILILFGKYKTKSY